MTTPCHHHSCSRPADIKHLIGRDMVLFCARHWLMRDAIGAAS